MQDDFAPKYFEHTTKHGVPWRAQVATTIVGAIAFITGITGPEVYAWLIATAGLTGFIAWVGIAISHFRFRRAFVKQGHQLSELKLMLSGSPLAQT